MLSLKTDFVSFIESSLEKYSFDSTAKQSLIDLKSNLEKADNEEDFSSQFKLLCKKYLYPKVVEQICQLIDQTDSSAKQILIAFKKAFVLKNADCGTFTDLPADIKNLIYQNLQQVGGLQALSKTCRFFNSHIEKNPYRLYKVEDSPYILANSSPELHISITGVNLSGKGKLLNRILNGIYEEPRVFREHSVSQVAYYNKPPVSNHLRLNLTRSHLRSENLYKFLRNTLVILCFDPTIDKFSEHLEHWRKQVESISGSQFIVCATKSDSYPKDHPNIKPLEEFSKNINSQGLFFTSSKTDTGISELIDFAVDTQIKAKRKASLDQFLKDKFKLLKDRDFKDVKKILMDCQKDQTSPLEVRLENLCKKLEGASQKQFLFLKFSTPENKMASEIRSELIEKFYLTIEQQTDSEKLTHLPTLDF